MKLMCMCQAVLKFPEQGRDGLCDRCRAHGGIRYYDTDKHDAASVKALEEAMRARRQREVLAAANKARKEGRAALEKYDIKASAEPALPTFWRLWDVRRAGDI